MVTAALFVAGVVLVLASLVIIWAGVVAVRARRTERTRRQQQLDSVYNSRMRRERGD